MSLMIGYELVSYRLTHLSWFNPFQTRVKPVITKNVYLPILKSIPDFTSQKNLIIFIRFDSVYRVHVRWVKN